VEGAEIPPGVRGDCVRRLRCLWTVETSAAPFQTLAPGSTRGSAAQAWRVVKPRLRLVPGFTNRRGPALGSAAMWSVATPGRPRTAAPPCRRSDGSGRPERSVRERSPPPRPSCGAGVQTAPDEADPRGGLRQAGASLPHRRREEGTRLTGMRRLAVPPDPPSRPDQLYLQGRVMSM
jgi:hypothetical protein